MCDFLSFFVSRKADKVRSLNDRYVVGDLRSHSASAKLADIKYGKGGDYWAEAEWTEDDDGASLIVRDDCADVLKAVILGDFKTRAKCLEFCLGRLPASLTTLDIGSLTSIPEGLKLPKGCQVIR